MENDQGSCNNCERFTIQSDPEAGTFELCVNDDGETCDLIDPFPAVSCRGWVKKD